MAMDIVIPKLGMTMVEAKVAEWKAGEGAWIDPAHRNAGVTRALMRLTWEVAKLAGRTWAFSAAADDKMRSILTRLGAAKVEAETYVFPLVES